jgi:anti-sigma factor RsiW
MKHFTYEEWKRYANDELPEPDREFYEDHLYSCDECLEVYLEAVAETELPSMESGSAFTDLVMAKISEEVKKPAQPRIFEEKKRRPFYQSPLFHYSLAAAMTILLMTTGVFQSITQYAGAVQDPDFQEKKTSVTEGLVDKTFAWMDTIEKKDKEENK